MTKKRRKNGKRNKKYKYTAKTADKFVLYEKAVQNVEADVEFLVDTFKAKRGRTPLTLRAPRGLGLNSTPPSRKPSPSPQPYLSAQPQP